MRDSDYPLLGEHYWKSDRQQGQFNRSKRDGEFLLPRIIEEFGDLFFTKAEFRDAFDAYVTTGKRDGDNFDSRKLHVVAGLHSLVDDEYVLEEGNAYQVTDLGRNFSEQLSGTPLIWAYKDSDEN